MVAVVMQPVVVVAAAAMVVANMRLSPPLVVVRVLIELVEVMVVGAAVGWCFCPPML